MPQCLRTLLCLLAVVRHDLSAEGFQEPTPSAARPHGVPELLVESLTRERRLEQLLQDLPAADTGELTADAVVALQQIFATPTDAFAVDSETGIARSIRQQALARIKSSDAAMRSWMAAIGPGAELRWKTTVVDGNRKALERLAWDFPLTREAMDASLLILSIDALKTGRVDAARSRRLKDDYFGTLLEPAVDRRLAQLASLAREQASPSNSTLSLSAQPVVDAISAPWPRAQWSWREASWGFPGAPQPDAGQVLDQFDQSLVGRIAEVANWRPIIVGQRIITRTPFRLVAFDLASGQEVWTLPTQTFHPEVVDEPSSDDQFQSTIRRTTATAELIARSPAYGLMSTDGDLLYFVDSLDVFRGDSLYPRLPVVREDEDAPPMPQGTRLVALRISDAGALPHVAWIAGDRGHFDYRPAASLSELTSREPEATIAESIPVESDVTIVDARIPVEPEVTATTFSHSLTGHRFLSPPVGSSTALFVLTETSGEYWINRLDRTSGAIQWQQPLAYAREGFSRFAPEGERDTGFSICLVDDDRVICLLHDGIVVSAGIADGRLEWATTVQDEPEVSRVPGFGIPGRYTPDVSDMPLQFVPRIADGIIVCSARNSRFVTGLDSATGRIIWREHRQAFGESDSGGSQDQMIAGITGQNVILIGERHCRSLDLKTGARHWTVEIAPPTGRAECRGDRCLIPISDGTVVSIDTRAGQIIDSPRIHQATNSSKAFGSITSTDDVVCLATPVSLTILPRADRVQQDAAVSGQSRLSPAMTILIRAQAALLDGRNSDAIGLLQSALRDLEATAVADDSRSPDRLLLEQACGELLLQQWAATIVGSNAGSAALIETAADIEARTKQLSDLQLTPEQRLRAATLELLGASSPGVAAATLSADLRAFPDWSRPVTITKAWSVRPDVLLEHLLPPVAASAQPELTPPTAWQLRARVPDSILFPASVAERDAGLATAASLLRSSRDAEAELLLLSLRSSRSEASEEYARLTRAIESVRRRDHVPGLADVAGATDPAGTTLTDELVANELMAGLTSRTKGHLHIDVDPYLRIPSAEWQEVEKGTPLFNVPDHVRLRYFHLNGVETAGRDQIVSFDPVDGTIRDRVSMPFDIGRGTIGFKLLETGTDAPSLMPLTGAGHVGIFSCASPGTSRVLWARKSSESTDGQPEQTIEFGPLGPNYFIWHAAGVLHCSHPLTGVDLWTRELSITPADTMFRQSRRIFGDAEAVVVMSADGLTCQRFATRTGNELGRSQLAIAPTHDPMPVGRCLMYVDASARLHAFDGATGADLLDDETPVLIGRHNPSRTFAMLGNGRVLTVSSIEEVILVDTRRGEITLRTPAKSLFTTQFVFGVTAFERNGHLFVGVEDEQEAPGEFVTQFNRVADPRVGPGALLCLDATNGDLKWAIRTDRALVPRIAGDATDVMVLWTQHRPSFRSRGEERRDIMNVRIIDGTSGRLMATASSLSTATPFRCAHAADERTIRLFTRDAEITIRPGAAD